MRTFSLAILLSLFAITLACAEIEVTTTPDRYSGQTATTARFGSQIRNEPLAPGIGFLVIAVGRTADLHLNSYNPTQSGWRYLKCNHLYFLIDGKRFGPFEARHDGSVGGSIISESMSYDFPPEFFAALKKARTVEGRICNSEFEWTVKQISGVQSVLP